MKNIKYLLLGVFIGLVCSTCKKEGNRCFRVKYRIGYCPKIGSSWVDFDQSASFTVKSDGGYAAALLNVPEKFRTPGMVFFVKVHYDKSLDVPDAIACPMDVVYPKGMKVAVCDWAGESCNQ